MHEVMQILGDLLLSSSGLTLHIEGFFLQISFWFILKTYKVVVGTLELVVLVFKFTGCVTALKFEPQTTLSACLKNNKKNDWIRMTDWLTDRWTGWLTDWQTDWLKDGQTDWLTGWLAACLADCLVDWLIDWLTDWLTGWLTDWLVGWLTHCCLYVFFSWSIGHYLFYISFEESVIQQSSVMNIHVRFFIWK